MKSWFALQREDEMRFFNDCAVEYEPADFFTFYFLLFFCLFFEIIFFLFFTLYFLFLYTFYF